MTKNDRATGVAALPAIALFEFVGFVLRITLDRCCPITTLLIMPLG